MAKVTKRQIIENTRNKVANQYKRRIENLENEVKYQKQYNRSLIDKFSKDVQEAEALKQKIAEQQEWIDRLLEYMDMSPRERDVYIALARADKESKERMKDLLDVYGSIFHF